MQVGDSIQPKRLSDWSLEKCWIMKAFTIYSSPDGTTTCRSSTATNLHPMVGCGMLPEAPSSCANLECRMFWLCFMKGESCIASDFYLQLLLWQIHESSLMSQGSCQPSCLTKDWVRPDISTLAFAKIPKCSLLTGNSKKVKKKRSIQSTENLLLRCWWSESWQGHQKLCQRPLQKFQKSNSFREFEESLKVKVTKVKLRRGCTFVALTSAISRNSFKETCLCRGREQNAVNANAVNAMEQMQCSSADIFLWLGLIFATWITPTCGSAPD